MDIQNIIPKPELQKLLLEAENSGMDFEVLQRITWFIHFAEHQSVSKTCKHFSIGRSTFYRWLERFSPEDLTSLEDLPTTTRQQEKGKEESVQTPKQTRQWWSLQAAQVALLAIIAVLLLGNLLKDTGNVTASVLNTETSNLSCTQSSQADGTFILTCSSQNGR